MPTRQVYITDVSMSLLCRFCKKKYMNLRWNKSASKEIYWTSIANWTDTNFSEEKYGRFKGKCDVCDRSEEHGEQLNRFPRRFLKFTVHVIMLVYIAYKILPLVELILHGGKMCKFSTLCDRLLSLSVFLLSICCSFYKLISLSKSFKSQY